MSFSRAVWPVLGASFVLLLVASACGSGTGSNVNGGGTGKAGSSTGPNLGNLAGNGSSSGGSMSGLGGDCAGDLIEAERIPLDMYVMLDVSGSMTEATAGDNTITKWDAVSSALSDFVKDPASAGMGMGLQVFPIVHPDAPASCKSNTQCGEFGPCFLKACWGYDEALVPCETDAYCDVFGPCIEFAQCAGNRDFVCAAEDIGLNCGTDPDTGQPLGACSALASSTCLSTADCRPATYATPATPIAELPGAQAALVAAIEAAGPEDGGLTPSGPALQGAIDQASSWAQAHPERQVVAVLATDGLPTLCEPVEITAVAKLAEEGRLLTPAISTFVIGVFGPADADAPANLNSIAESGGTGKAFLVDTAGDVQKQFRDALNKIRATGLSCELAVPTAMDGKAVDYNQVNVTFDSGSGPANLLGVANLAGCGADGGWYYDVDPEKETPKRIVACPSTCTKFQQTDMGSVQIRLGCPRTRVK
jgi:hypothetical protein